MASQRRRDLYALSGIALVSVVALVGIGVLLLGRHSMGHEQAQASVLPTLNAFLNAMSAILLTSGFWFIRHRKVTAHRACMLTAFGVSSLFLISYLIHHHNVGSVPFSGVGWTRALYNLLLIPHIVLAACVLPLALAALYRALRGQFDLHRKIVRWALPIWLYVSVSGVVVYWMLYRL